MRPGVLTPAQIKQVVAAQQTTGLRFGAQAVQLGLATRTNVLQALSAQQGVSYLAAIDTDRVRSAPGALTRDQVKALGVVPFHQNGNDLLVACAAPVPRAAIAALESLLRVTVEPFLVTDADLERLVAAYGGAVADLTTTASPVRDVDDGASRIAAMAARLRAVQMTTARIARFTWVRINADGQASTMLVPPAAGTMETESWLAATTQH
jgi:hypothetical protein